MNVTFVALYANNITSLFATVTHIPEAVNSKQILNILQVVSDHHHHHYFFFILPID
jgi:hypothetical protein